MVILQSFLILLFNLWFTYQTKQEYLDIFDTTIYGSIILCIALLNFFFSLNKFLNTVILILPIIILIKKRKIYFSKRIFVILIIISIIISLLITESNVYRPDAGLYHLPIKNLNDEKIIFYCRITF